MKVLIVNTSDIGGGAARAAHRLHEALLGQGVDSQMLVQENKSKEYRVLLPSEKKTKKIFNKVRPFIDQAFLYKYKNRSKTPFSVSFLPSKDVIKKINELEPDVVHLHWVCAGFLNIEDIGLIKKPIVWSLHDMWPFTGGCHYDENCGKYVNSCGSCKVLQSKSDNDLSRKIWERKKKNFSKKNINVIGLSRWLEKCAKESFFLKKSKVVNLPNPINPIIFKPVNKTIARELWDLPNEKKLILFGAMNATGDLRKGFKELSNALYELQSKDVELVIFGSSEPKQSQNFGFKTHYLGQLSDDVSLATLYSAVEIMVVPSLQENLSNAIMESLSCGTPVIGFNIGGNSDMIDHKINGYLAKPFDPSDLARGIEWVLNAPNYEELCKNAREKVLREFDYKVVAPKYIELYQEILSENKV